MAVGARPADDRYAAPRPSPDRGRGSPTSGWRWPGWIFGSTIVRIMERGLEIEPTEHMGVHATQMERRGLDVSRARLDEEAAQRNADLIREKPEQVLSIITNEKSVFDRHDIARTLHRYINDDPQAFQNAFATVMASPALVELQRERIEPGNRRDRACPLFDPRNGRDRIRHDRECGRAVARRRKVMASIGGMLNGRSAARMPPFVPVSPATQPGRSSGANWTPASVNGAWRRRGFRTSSATGDRAYYRAGADRGGCRLCRRWQVHHACRCARSMGGRRAIEVHGAALSGKAAEGLEESSGIQEPHAGVVVPRLG
jgi:hypothetical protein